MGSLTLDHETLDSNIYLLLGLKTFGKGVTGSPRILSLLSLLLEKTVQTNEKLVETMQIKDVATVFHGLRAPTISIQQYVHRIFKYSGCSPSCFVVANIYLDRFLQQSDVHLTSLNVHRLLITSILLAAKFFDDAYFNNAYYARVGGVTTEEMNILEMKFLFTLDFRLQVNIKTFQTYCSQLEKDAGEGLQIERPIKACGINESWSSKTDAKRAPTIAR